MAEQLRGKSTEVPPGPIAAAWSCIGAARSAEGATRVVYCAEARNLIGSIREELRILELNLGHVEQALTTEEQANG